MKPLFSKYAELCHFLDERPDRVADWKRLALVLVAGYCATVLVRLLEAPNWSGPAFLAGTERLLATHDAYCWLAGAKGVNEYAGFGMAGLARLLSSLFGAPLWAVAFWSPPFLASFTAVVTGLWAWRLAGRRAALAASFLGALTPGFYFRSRLGYFDSDFFTLLMPLLLGFGLATLLAGCCSQSWQASDAERQEPAPLPAWLPWLALGFGLVARVAHFAHDDVQPLGIGLYWLSLGLLAVTGLPGRRLPGLRLLLVYGLAAYGGARHFGVEVFQPGLADAAALVLAALLAWLLGRKALPEAPARRPHPWLESPWLDSPWPWLAGLLVLILACGLLVPLGGFWAKALSYFKPVADAGLAVGAAGAQVPSYPGITQSIREATNVSDWATFFAGVSAFEATGIAGLLGMLALAALRPAFLLLLPLAVIGFASLKLGTRFTMFAGPVFTLGLCIGAHWLAKGLVRRFALSQGLLTWVQVFLATACLLLGYVPRYAGTRPTPVLAPAHAEALMGLGHSAPKGSQVWTWWDYGYATQYFSGHMTPADGGKHAGRDIYATALALTTSSFRQAAQVMGLSASLGNNPARHWDTLSAQAVQQELAALKESAAALPPAPPQYLVVCWENLNLLYWISFYGSWDVVSGKGAHAGVLSLREPFTVDKATGRLVPKSGGTSMPLASGEILTEKGVQRLELQEHTEGGAHLIVNDLTKQAMLLDDMAYGSMAVQLLIGDPSRPELARYFKLLHEGFPLVRIYEVLPASQGPAAQAKAKQP